MSALSKIFRLRASSTITMNSQLSAISSALIFKISSIAFTIDIDSTRSSLNRSALQTARPVCTPGSIPIAIIYHHPSAMPA